MNKSIMDVLFPGAFEKAAKGICPSCNKEVSEKDFRNKISKREFKISGLCQECQDLSFV